MSISNKDYLNKLIAKAKKSWKGVDVESYMSDLRDNSFDKEFAENLSKEVASYITEQMKSNMKTIEERAKEWGEHIVETTPYDVVNGKACVFVEDRNIADVADAYIAGAKDQQYIDRLLIEQLIDKACNIFCHTGGAHKIDSYNRLNDKCDTWKVFKRMIEEEK